MTDFKKLNERKNHYQIVDDDTIQNLVRYYKLERDHKKHVLRFAKEACVRGDTFD